MQASGAYHPVGRGQLSRIPVDSFMRILKSPSARVIDAEVKIDNS